MTEQEITQAPPPASTGERAELIAHVKDTSANLEPYQRHRAKGLRAAADMLEADAQEIAGWKADQKENLRNQVELQEQINGLKAQQVAVPYDQQAMELCPECGWKAIMPGEPCFVCNMQVAAPAWTLTADKMPEPCMNVMAYTGKGQPIRAQWVPAKTLEDNGDGDFGEYDEATDMYYWPEAWYETNAHEETHWMVDGHVTHWMPLPLPPQGGKP